METRVDKYNESTQMSRVAKNENLYKEINSDELDSFNLHSNATVIGNQEQEIDVEQIKKILDKRYNDAPKRRSIRVEPRVETSRLVEEEPTKEYDLNLVLEKAKDEKVETYEENRAKKLRNTQFDILSTLNIPEEKEEKNQNSAEEDLMELINTITINESKKKEEEISSTDPLSILEDLKGSENTQVYESMSTEVTRSVEIREKPEVKEENSDETTDGLKDDTKEKVDNSFYTKDLFKNKDFENEDDFVEEEKMNLGIKILIILIVVAFVVGLIIFLKSFLNF